MAWKFERVAGPYKFIEGPIWTGEEVFFTDIPNSRVMRFDPTSNDCEEYRTGTNEANGLVLDKEGQLFACEGSGDGRRIVHYDPNGGKKVLADRFCGHRLNSPNDLVFDALGSIWFTDPRYGDRTDMELDHESVFRLDQQQNGSWMIDRITYDTTRPNGLIVTPDLKTLYVAQSDYGEGTKRELRAYPINEDASVGKGRVLHDFGPDRGIDGMTLDSDLNIVASAGWDKGGPGPSIYVFAPDGGVIERHDFPCPPTNCCFGGEELSDLYITASDGCLYRAGTDRKGIK